MTAPARTVIRNRQLTRLMLSWACWITVESAGLIVLSVVAFERAGAGAVGLIGAVLVLPGAASSPFASVVTDRVPRPRILAGIHLIWCGLTLVLAWIAAAEVSFAVLLLVVAAASVIGSPFKPCVNAITPQLVRTPEELVAANSARSAFEAAGIVAGPVLAGVLLSLLGPARTLIALSVVLGGAAVVSLLIATEFRPPRRRRVRGRAVLLETLRGFGALTAPGCRLVLVPFVAQTLMRGLLNVFLVVLALDVARSDVAGSGVVADAAGEGQVSTFFAAIGIGGLVGAVATLGAGGGSRGARRFGLGVVLWGLPVLAIGIWPHPAVALAALVVLGFGNAVEDVYGVTLLNRMVPDHLAGRAFGALWGVAALAVAVGSLAAPVLISALGLRSAMALSGAALALLPVLLWRALTRLDAAAGPPPASVGLLRQVPLLAPLSAIALERLAHRARELDLGRGQDAVREGEIGDLYYVIADGTLAVTQQGREIRRLAAGDAFGEIALIEAVPRTATVTALTPSVLLAIDEESFVAAVTGQRDVETVARSTIDRLLREHPPKPPPGGPGPA